MIGEIKSYWEHNVNTWEEAIDVILEAFGEPKTLMDAFDLISKAMIVLLYNKQKRYGKENIKGSSMKEAHAGLYFRMRDKLARIRNASIEGVDLGEESRLDSYGDEIGYGAIGISLEKNWFDLPLRDDNKNV